MSMREMCWQSWNDGGQPANTAETSFLTRAHVINALSQPLTVYGHISPTNLASAERNVRNKVDIFSHKNQIAEAW